MPPRTCEDCRHSEPCVAFCGKRGGHIEMTEAPDCAEYEPRAAFDESQCEAAAHFAADDERKDAHGR